MLSFFSYYVSIRSTFTTSKDWQQQETKKKTKTEKKKKTLWRKWKGNFTSVLNCFAQKIVKQPTKNLVTFLSMINEMCFLLRSIHIINIKQHQMNIGTLVQRLRFFGHQTLNLRKYILKIEYPCWGEVGSHVWKAHEVNLISYSRDFNNFQMANWYNWHWNWHWCVWCSTRRNIHYAVIDPSEPELCIKFMYDLQCEKKF